MKKAKIYFENVFIKEIIFDTFSSQLIEKSYFFMKNQQNVAIIPHNFLVVFENDFED